MGLRQDMRVLYHMVFSRGKGKSHAERMESFYGAQARDYDDRRHRDHDNHRLRGGSWHGRKT